MGLLGITLPTQIRCMSPLEYGVVSGVFGSTLPDRSRIFVTDAAGLNGRPFTIPAAMMDQVGMAPLPPMAAGAPTGILRTGYLMNVGEKAFTTLGTLRQFLLVHETAHVWQGHNGILPVSYVVGSVIAQCLHGARAYNFTAGKPWKSYNPEQQAMIVEQWFAMGQSQKDPLYPYIDQHVRKGDC